MRQSIRTTWISYFSPPSSSSSQVLTFCVYSLPVVVLHGSWPLLDDFFFSVHLYVGHHHIDREKELGPAPFIFYLPFRLMSIVEARQQRLPALRIKHVPNSRTLGSRRKRDGRVGRSRGGMGATSSLMSKLSLPGLLLLLDCDCRLNCCRWSYIDVCISPRRYLLRPSIESFRPQQQPKPSNSMRQ